jgi:hypothetical protein
MSVRGWRSQAGIKDSTVAFDDPVEDADIGSASLRLGIIEGGSGTQLHLLRNKTSAVAAWRILSSRPLGPFTGVTAQRRASGNNRKSEYGRMFRLFVVSASPAISWRVPR